MQFIVWRGRLSQPLPISQSLVSLKRLTYGIGILKDFSAYETPIRRVWVCRGNLHQGRISRKRSSPSSQPLNGV